MRRLSIFALLMVGLNASVQAQGDKAPESFYRFLTGTVADQPVSMQWQKAGDEVRAAYEYQEYGQKIELEFIKDSSSVKSLFFSEGLNEDREPVDVPIWQVHIQDGKLTGQWRSADGSENYDIFLEENYPEGVQRFDYLSKDTSAVINPPDTSSPAINLQIIVPKATGAGDKAKWLNGKVKHTMEFDTGRSLSENLIAWTDSNIVNYRTFRDGNLARNSPIWNWDNIERLWVSYNQHNYVTYTSEGYNYSGGAHGMSWKRYYVYDLKNESELQLSDIVLADSTELQPLLEAQFRVDNNLGSTEPLTEYLFEDKLMPNDNYSFSNDGLCFTYGQYEIAPYAYGIITVVITWKQLKPYINPVFADR